MTVTKSKTITQDPATLNAVKDRRAAIQYFASRTYLPADSLTAASLIELGVDTYIHAGVSPQWIVSMLREYAATIELFHAEPAGKA